MCLDSMGSTNQECCDEMKAKGKNRTDEEKDMRETDVR